MIPPSYVRVLEAIMRLHRERRIVTPRVLYREMKMTADYLVISLGALTSAGLIQFNGRSGDTIVPRVRFIPESEL